MSGYCGKCGEHCMDCQCGVQMLGCLPNGSIISSFGPSPEMMPIPDHVNHPSHYQGNSIEVIDIIEDFQLGFHLGNAIKYILRSDKKGRKEEDLRKAIWYLERELTQYE